MIVRTVQAGWRPRGWMKFTIAATGILHLGGATPTAPDSGTAYLSADYDLSAGIPQNKAGTEFAVVTGDTNSNLKHARIRVLSGSCRVAEDGSTPTAALGELVDATSTPQEWVIRGSQRNIRNFKAYVVTNAVFEVAVYS